MSCNAANDDFPCLICRKEVKENHNALLCVTCNKWAHFKCSRASWDTFNSDRNWTCDICLFKELPQTVHFNEIDTYDPSQHRVDGYKYDSVENTFDKLKSSSGINIAHLNVCSLLKNIDEVKHILINNNIHIFSLCETRLDESVSEAEICIPGYRSVRLDRNRNGGGIITYIKDNIPFNVKQDLMVDDLELMCIEVSLPKQKTFMVVYWYRPPNSQNIMFD